MIRLVLFALTVLVLMTFSMAAFASRSKNSHNSQFRVMTQFKSITTVSTKEIVIRDVTLQARDESILPPSSVPDPSRDVGFAIVTIHMENHTEEPMNVRIENIEIRNVSNGQVQLALTSPQVVVLRPLEYAEQVFRLSNPSGYSRHRRVKAVITYRLGDQIGYLESEPVEVER